jgi:hypothetical protein
MDREWRGLDAGNTCESHSCKLSNRGPYVLGEEFKNSRPGRPTLISSFGSSSYGMQVGCKSSADDGSMIMSEDLPDSKLRRSLSPSDCRKRPEVISAISDQKWEVTPKGS